MGEFEEYIYSDYIIFLDNDLNSSFVVHRIARPAPASPRAEGWKQTDPGAADSAAHVGNEANPVASTSGHAPAYISSAEQGRGQMSEKEVFVAHLERFVAWMRSHINIRSDIPAQDYSESFIAFLAFRFPVTRGFSDNSPAGWLRSLAATAGSIHEMPRGGCLMLVEMSDAQAPEDPVQHRTYHDDRGVLHIEFMCKRSAPLVEDDDEEQKGQVVRLTNLTDGSHWI